MTKPLRHLCATIGLLFSASLTAADDAFRETLQHELDNRGVATAVVGKLAERHGDTPQGRFWAAYAELERLQAPRYAQAAQRHGLQARPSALKVRLSLFAAGLFPEFFLGRLATATRAYLDNMRATPAPGNPTDDRLQAYMIEQEARQVDAIAAAAAGRFKEAEDILRQFNASLEALPEPAQRPPKPR